MTKILLVSSKYKVSFTHTPKVFFFFSVNYILNVLHLNELNPQIKDTIDKKLKVQLATKKFKIQLKLTLYLRIKKYFYHKFIYCWPIIGKK